MLQKITACLLFTFVINTINAQFTPVKEPFTPVKKPFKTVKEPFTKVEKPFTEIDSAFKPVKNAYTPVQNSFVRVDSAFKTVSEAYTPVRNSFMTVDSAFDTNELGSPVQHAFFPVRDGFTQTELETITEFGKPVEFATVVKDPFSEFYVIDETAPPISESVFMTNFTIQALGSGYVLEEGVIAVARFVIKTAIIIIVCSRLPVACRYIKTVDRLNTGVTVYRKVVQLVKNNQTGN